VWNAVKDLRDAQVPRAELDRVFAAYDQRFLDQQRQLSDMKESQGSVCGARDVIMDLKTNQQRLERELSDTKTRAGGQAIACGRSMRSTRSRQHSCSLVGNDFKRLPIRQILLGNTLLRGS
jgi:hypothetical protein